jgi:NADPH-dependent ferric siderophore reductase
MTPPSERATTIASRLEGAVALDLAVVETYEVTKGILELTLEGDLTGFSPWPGQDVMVSVPPGYDAARWRRYTVRHIDAASSTIDVWVTTDTDGPGASWASNAEVGDRVEAVGPRGKITLDEGAATHLFVADSSGVSAMCAMAEGVVAPALVATFALMAPVSGIELSTAIAPLCAEGVPVLPHVFMDDRMPMILTALNVTITHLEAEPIAVYVFGELSLTREIVEDLVERGFDPARIVSKPYWRKGRANESNGEPMREEAAGSE